MPGIEKNQFRNTRKNPQGAFQMCPTQKLAWAERRIRQWALGNMKSIECPYCLSRATSGVEKLYCEPMGEATETVLRHMETESSARRMALTFTLRSYKESQKPSKPG